MRRLCAFLFIVLLLGVSWSSPSYAGYGEIFGTVSGAAVGAAAGAALSHGNTQPAATGAGLLAGAALAAAIGATVDDSPSIRPISYRRYTGPPEFFSDPPPSPLYGTVYAPNYVAPPDLPPPPPPIYVDRSYGSYCRQYSQPVRVNNGVQESYGTTCLQPDGSWRVVQ